MLAVAEVGRVLLLVALLLCIFGQTDIIKYFELLILNLSGNPHQELLQDSLTGLVFKLLTLREVEVQTLILDFLFHSRHLPPYFFEVLLIRLLLVRQQGLGFLSVVELTPISIRAI